MRAMVGISILVAIGCAQAAPDEADARASDVGRSGVGRDVGAVREFKAVAPPSKSRVAELVANRMKNEAFRESRRITGAEMLDRDRLIIDKLGLPRADAERFAEILREHREAKLEVQELLVSLATAGVGREERRAALEASPALAKAKPGFVRASVQQAFGRDKVVAYERTRDELLSPTLASRDAVIRANKTLGEVAR